MSGFALGLLEARGPEIDASALQPQNLEGLNEDGVRRLRVNIAGRGVRVGELFSVSSIDTSVLVFKGTSIRLQRIGSGMLAGEIQVEGPVGDEVGANMRDGRVVVKGSVGAYLGSGMRGGHIEVSGDAGDSVGGVMPSASLGLGNGTICVNGNAGARVGERMRRGLIVVNGDVGPYCGANLIAGTIVLGGRVANSLGVGMRRGTVVCTDRDTKTPPSFNDCGVHTLTSFTLLKRYVDSINRRAGKRLKNLHELRRFVGDIGADGQGEILVAVG